jgi:uncharacterized protein YndB with AHSA1/START domain
MPSHMPDENKENSFMTHNRLRISLTIPASCDEVWKKIADWQSQGDWMLHTKVWLTSDQKEGVGTSIAAFTGPFYKIYPAVKYLGLLDLMRVTHWDPPHRCDVEHFGKLLKGSGTFELTPIASNQTKFDWSETVIAPRLVFIVIAPFLYVGVRISLARFARLF